MIHLQKELEKLKKKLLTLTGVVEQTVLKAVKSVSELDPELSREIISGDIEIDSAEVDIEEDCLKLMALYQPVATDLRFLITVLKVNDSIERIGDLAVNIAERSLSLCRKSLIKMPFDLAEMVTKTLNMLKGGLDSLMKQDADLAREVRALDDEIDDINREMYTRIGAAVRSNPEHIEQLLSYLSVSRHLERIADYTTNIAEDVIYLIEGEIVRHTSPEFP